MEQYLTDHGFFNALILGLSDYEGSVRKEFGKIRSYLENNTDLIPPQSSYKYQKVENSGNDSPTQHRPKNRTSTNLAYDDYADDIVDDVIEDIVVAGDSDLISQLSLDPKSTADGNEPIVADFSGQSLPDFQGKSLMDFQQFCRRRDGDGNQGGGTGEEEEEDRLKSVLDDIISSVRDGGLIDLIDCY
eukprot:TRINITY_DN32615_c0_g1_i1.p1 TRINITY_DN32615_c0_g1~~TRINITY_DN32615_c0_g1_i1.p1  ORF type:complete len:208 (-),score=36.37 TRINITY_DN32615_c0_g1_i1:93-656(-)